ncbi:MAG: protein-L-isoaspartate(D-aspartate) O-methyltransferase, partial [Deltaproteobacteria bacterium]|nr:protein-L-isoaspartate(D-aspartate) O-methyltransferase [Deltaproteobacteria bacterium]
MLGHRKGRTVRAGIILVFMGLLAQATPVMADRYSIEREAMVLRQIEGRGVSDPKVLQVMREVPRHLFVPEELRRSAYQDYPLPIGYNQTISQPYIVALMTEKLKLEGHEKVLEIGTGSGYQAAVLSGLCKHLFTIEIVKPLAERARDLLKGLGYGNVTVRYGDGYKGWPEEAPFDAIIVTAAPPEVPPKLVEQLKTGGRLVVPVGTLIQELVLIEKKQDEVVEKSLLPVRFVPM